MRWLRETRRGGEEEKEGERDTQYNKKTQYKGEARRETIRQGRGSYGKCDEKGRTRVRQRAKNGQGEKGKEKDKETEAKLGQCTLDMGAGRRSDVMIT